jgi:endonuclease YncB( thermonuclease family)
MPRRGRRSLSKLFPLRRKPWVTALVLLLLVALIYADQRGWLLVPAGDDIALYHQRSFLVTRVIDGDTIELAAIDRVTGAIGTRVRLWGIDCPEMGWQDRHAEPWALEATDFTRQLCEGEMVVLRLESRRLRDVYDRLLAHVTAGGGVNVSEAILRAGLARADERWRHEMLEAYRQAEQDGRKANAGLWSDGPGSRMGELTR